MARWANGGHGDMDVGNVDDDEDADEAGFRDYGPLDVREKMRDTNAVMRATDELVTKAKGVPRDFLHQWTLTYIAWSRLWDRFNGLPGVVGQFRDEMYRRADLFTRTALAFVEGVKTKKWLAAPIKAPTPKKVADVKQNYPDDVRTKSMDDKWPLWKWLVFGGVIAGGSYAAYRLWPKDEPHQISDAEAMAYLAAKG
jgi:hypothetical protein